MKHEPPQLTSDQRPTGGRRQRFTGVLLIVIPADHQRQPPLFRRWSAIEPLVYNKGFLAARGRSTVYNQFLILTTVLPHYNESMYTTLNSSCKFIFKYIFNEQIK